MGLGLESGCTAALALRSALHGALHGALRGARCVARCTVWFRVWRTAALLAIEQARHDGLIIPVLLPGREQRLFALEAVGLQRLAVAVVGASARRAQVA